MFKPIQPVLADMRVLSPHTRSLINPLFDDLDIGLVAILISYYSDDPELVATAPNNFYFCDDRGDPVPRTWKTTHIDEAKRSRFSNAMLTLSEEDELTDRVRDLGQNYGSLPQRNYFSATIMRHCIILSHGDLESYVAESLHCIRSEFKTVDTRSSICTVIVPPDGSNHSRIRRLDKVQSDIQCFRKIHSAFFDALRQEHGFDLGEISTEDRSAYMMA